MKCKSKACQQMAGAGACLFTCDSHLFQLLPLVSGGYFEQKVTLSCCPVFNKKLKKSEGIWPEINTDNIYYTPFFVLEADKESVRTKLEDYKATHQQRVNNQLLSKREIMLPHPGSNKHTCFVCKDQFEDYQTHIESTTHKMKLRNSKASKYVTELITELTVENEKQIKFLQKKNRIQKLRERKQDKLLRMKEKERRANGTCEDAWIALEKQRIVVVIESESPAETENRKKQTTTEPSANKGEEGLAVASSGKEISASFAVSDYLL